MKFNAGRVLDLNTPPTLVYSGSAASAASASARAAVWSPSDDEHAARLHSSSAAPGTACQGLTLVHFSSQRQNFSWHILVGVALSVSNSAQVELKT